MNSNNSPNSTGSSPLEENKELINLLASEILKISELNATFRTRIAFAFWIGPFVVLGALLIAVKDGTKVDGLQIDQGVFTLFILSVTSYIAIGFLGGMIEKANNIYCDRLREIIQKLSLESVSTEILKGYRFGVADSLLGENSGLSVWAQSSKIGWFVYNFLRLLLSKVLVAYSFAYCVMILQAFLLAGIIYYSVAFNEAKSNKVQDEWQFSIKYSKDSSQ